MTDVEIELSAFGLASRRAYGFKLGQHIEQENGL